MVNLCIRPFAEQLLKYLLESTEIYTIIYTASPYEYAAKILPILLPIEKTACSGDSRILDCIQEGSEEQSARSHTDRNESRKYRTQDSKIFLLCREDCLSTDFKNVMLKDLQIFEGSTLDNCIIVDNSLYSFGKYLNNGIKIKSWYGLESDDEELRKLHEEIDKWKNGVDVLKPQNSLV